MCINSPRAVESSIWRVPLFLEAWLVEERLLDENEALDANQHLQESAPAWLPPWTRPSPEQRQAHLTVLVPATTKVKTNAKKLVEKYEQAIDTSKEQRKAKQSDETFFDTTDAKQDGKPLTGWG